MSWSASQYVAFEDERTRPARDLLAAVPSIQAPLQARRVVDIGCGPGNSTQLLAARFPEAIVTGLDSSPDMIQAARVRLPQVRFELISIESWDDPGPFDVILANAVLQWVTSHGTLFPSLVMKLTLGGSLAVQMPDNLDEPAHRLMREIAVDGPWAGKLAAAASKRTRMASADWYYGILRGCCGRVDVWRTIYHHPLAGGAAAVVEWFKGSGLRPFLEPLDEQERAAYLERYTVAITDAYPAMTNGAVLLPFPRLFIVATR
jgi:trans-aconitate 2-methyltransferase